MSFWSSTLDLLGFAAESEPTGESSLPPAGILPHRRDAGTTAERALTLSTLYRGVFIHATSVVQLDLNVKRNGLRIADRPDLIVKPDINESRDAFLEYTTCSLYIDGNAFWKIDRYPASSPRVGQVMNLTAVNPAEVAVIVKRDGFGSDTITYSYRGKSYDRRSMSHLKLLRIPGLHRGLGPIQAAQIEVRGALDARDYGSMWLTDANMPDGILTTDQELKPGHADQYRNVWYGRNPDGTAKADDTDRNPNERLRVLGAGLSYTPLLLKPSDIQFLETQQFSTVQMARLIGAPASLMLVAVDGSSETYSNVEQEWIGYVRFGLMKPLREIETAFTELLPGKQEAKFDVDGLWRTDTKTRYEANALALDPVRGWATVDEIRADEDLTPLTADQRAELDARRPKSSTAPAKESTPA